MELKLFFKAESVIQDDLAEIGTRLHALHSSVLPESRNRQAKLLLDAATNLIDDAAQLQDLAAQLLNTEKALSEVSILKVSPLAVNYV